METLSINPTSTPPETGSTVDSPTKSKPQLLSPLHLSDPPPLVVNDAALRFWQHTGYSREEMLSLCREIDGQRMFAMISFSGERTVGVRLSTNTWERQEGHYPTMVDTFSALAQHPLLAHAKGDLIVWLEDGMWMWDRHYSWRVPMLAFGRHASDATTLLIPDPAYLGSAGYEDELARLRLAQRENPWSSKQDTIYWRGAATGGFSPRAWRRSARGSMVLASKKLKNPAILDAKITKTDHLSAQCRREVIAAKVTGDEIPFTNFLRYKYLVDADGQCCAWKSLFLKMASGSVVLKIHSPYQQWYHHRMIPWRHFIPIREDFADYREIYDWLQSHDDETLAIAQSGARLMESLTLTDTLHEMAIYCQALLACQRD